MAVREDSRIKKAIAISGLADSFMSYEDNVHGLHAEDFQIIMDWCQ